MVHYHGPKCEYSGKQEHTHDSGEHAHEFPSHIHEHSVVHRREERKCLMLAMVLTGSMMLVELAGGIYTNSLALISDAGHMFTHFLALIVSFLAIYFASRPVSKEKSFGLYRLEILAALFNGATIILITVYLFYKAYQRLLHPVEIATREMFIIAVAGLLVNLLSAIILSRASREDINVRSAFLHMIGDTFSSVGVVVGAVLIYRTGYLIIDPILSFFIALVILIWGITLVIDSIHILLESAPKHIVVDELVKGLIAEVKEIRDIDDIHVWQITSGMYSLTANIVVKDCKLSEVEKVRKKINKFLDNNYHITHTTVQFECGR